MLYVGNAFSLQMIPEDRVIEIRNVTKHEARVLVHSDPSISCVGHADTAAVFSEELKYPVACNRNSICLNYWDVLLVGQLTGGRLPEGATTLPDGFDIQWKMVRTVGLLPEGVEEMNE